jgi:hypothetical protein
MAKRHKYILHKSCKGTQVGPVHNNHMVFVAQLSIWLQELYPQQHHDQFGKFLEMQPLPGLDAHGLGAEQEGLFTVCGSSRVGELELAPVLLGIFGGGCSYRTLLLRMRTRAKLF